MLTYKTFVLGPIDNNSIVLYDDETREGILIDPSFEPEPLVNFIKDQGLHVEKVLLTHGHFDHYYGLPYVQSMLPTVKEIYLHADDLALWKEGGGARKFIGKVLELPDPDHLLQDSQEIMLGKYGLKTFHTPGHTPGSVVFYSSDMNTVFCGDLIFYHGIGRTDLDGGNYAQLIQSIQIKIFSLPSETFLISGHGPETTVGEEIENNPFLR